jgi:hypothetical protein
MFAELNELWQVTLTLLNEPIIRAGTTVLAVISAILGIWAAQKARSVLHTHEQQILVRQNQLMDDQWQQINHALLVNDKAAAAIGQLMGVDDVALFQQQSFFFILLNLLASAWVSRVSDILSEEIYDAHFRGVAIYFQNRAELFFSVIPPGVYTRPFLEDCKRRFTQLDPLSGNEVRERMEGYGKMLDKVS